MTVLKHASHNLLLLMLATMALSSCELIEKETKKETTDPVNNQSSVVFNPDKTYGTMTDYDGNTYKTITIGTQTWMAENLRVTHYQNGSAIPNITDNKAWTRLTTDAYCNYNNTKNADTIATYGRLYNWYAVVSANNIAPKGWHVPTETEWATLTKFLKGNELDANNMIEVGTTHWKTRTLIATNASGFSAVPAGKRYDEDGVFYSLGTGAYFWSSTKCNDSGWALNLSNGNSSYLNKFFQPCGFSVRLIKD